MPRETRKWHPRFLHYMKTIVAHPNYQGLPIETKADGTLRWIASARSEIGRARNRLVRRKGRKTGHSHPGRRLCRRHARYPSHEMEGLPDLRAGDVAVLSLSQREFPAVAQRHIRHGVYRMRSYRRYLGRTDRERRERDDRRRLSHQEGRPDARAVFCGEGRGHRRLGARLPEGR